MKKFLIYAAAAFAFLACENANEFGRIDQLDENIAVPSPVTIKSVRNIPGGAVIKISLPDEDVIRGVIATYVRNGEEVDTKVSRYCDSLVVEGYPNTDPQTVKVYAFNVNEVRSEPVEVTINPLVPSIQTVSSEILSTFGGVKIHVTGNDDKGSMAVCLLRCEDIDDSEKPVNEIKWKEVTTLFTALDNVILTRRGIEPTPAIFGAYFRDRWGNISDTTKIVLTPSEEYRIIDTLHRMHPRRDFNWPCDPQGKDDTTGQNSSTYPVKNLWDGTNDQTIFEFTKGSPRPCWFTIDLGHPLKLSRINLMQRKYYNEFKNAAIRVVEFWGCLNSDGETDESRPYGFNSSWMQLGKFEYGKLSGYMPDGSVGEITTEDLYNYNWEGWDFELDENEYPDANATIRYLRVIVHDTFGTYGTNSATLEGVFGELTPYGCLVPEKTEDPENPEVAE